MNDWELMRCGVKVMEKLPEALTVVVRLSISLRPEGRKYRKKGLAWR